MKNSSNFVAEIWTRIEAVLVAHATEVIQTLSPPASAAEIAKLEAGIGLSLPGDLRRSLEIHNGQNDPTQCLNFCGRASLMSSADILRDWNMLTEIGVDLDRVNGIDTTERNSLNGDWWRRSCIPFGHFNGEYWCVDTLAGLGLEAGRIVEFTRNGPMEETNVRSFADWLEQVASALEENRFDRQLYGSFRVHPRFEGQA